MASPDGNNLLEAGVCRRSETQKRNKIFYVKGSLWPSFMKTVPLYYFPCRAVSNIIQEPQLVMGTYLFKNIYSAQIRIYLSEIISFPCMCEWLYNNIIVSLLQFTAKHRPPQLLAILVELRLLASSSCQPSCANRHSTWPEYNNNK
jgi:hypothetical protein